MEEPGTVAHGNPITLGAEVGGSRVGNQVGLHSPILSPKIKIKIKIKYNKIKVMQSNRRQNTRK
jgi:hypothetical protein